MNVTVVGAGRVGRALAANLAGAGHAVTVAVGRDPDEPFPDGTTTAPLDGAGATADLTVLAVPFDAVAQVVPRLGLPDGAVLVDATNPFGRTVPAGLPSGAAHVAAVAGPDVHVVKAFNVLGAEHMASPALPDGACPLLPVAGDDTAARDRVVVLAAELGFDAVAVGGLDAAALLEEAARYWGLLAFAGGLGRQVVLVAHRRAVP
ncbi:NADPH-dependent F420 reductase [Aquipuribacter nitratireducens]|uniref:NADPH-dependent F420 reductase n=1 Tax=Aquipuribacter nitratireducens TaxID=650104 RepID=A0ABW0GHH8_9MICO